jgi:hypothetical protein
MIALVTWRAYRRLTNVGSRGISIFPTWKNTWPDFYKRSLQMMAFRPICPCRTWCGIPGDPECGYAQAKNIAGRSRHNQSETLPRNDLS